MPTINYKFNISRESDRFNLKRLNDNDSAPLIAVDNIENGDDRYSYTYNDDLHNSYKTIFENTTENNKRIVRTNTLDIAASDKQDPDGNYLYNKVLLKMTGFTKILINDIEHTVIDSNFVYTNESRGKIEYFKNDTLLFQERIEVFPVYICRRNMHMSNIIDIDQKYWNFEIRNNSISIQYSGIPNIKIRNPGSLFSTKIASNKLMLDGFYYRTYDEESSLIYSYCDFIQDIRTVTDRHIPSLKSGSVNIGNTNILPESIVLRIFRRSSNIYERTGIELGRITINEGARFYTDEYIFTTSFASYGEDSPEEIYNIALPIACLNRTDGIINFDLPEKMKSDDVYGTISYSYCNSLGISKTIEERNIIDVYVGPTSVISNGVIRTYDENISILYDDETFKFDNGLRFYNFDITDPVELDGEVILTESNMIPTDSRFTSTDANGYGVGEYSPGIDFDFYETISQYTEYRMIYESSTINVLTATKRKNKNPSIYINGNMARPIDLSTPVVLKNNNFNSIQHYLGSPVEIIETAGIMYHTEREGVFINGSEVSRDETYIYLEFDAESIISSMDTAVSSHITADADVLDFLNRFVLPGYTDGAVDYSSYAMFTYEEGVYTKITDVSVLLYNVDDEIIKVAMPVSYAGSIVGLGLDSYTTPLIPKLTFEI